MPSVRVYIPQTYVSLFCISMEIPRRCWCRSCKVVIERCRPSKNEAHPMLAGRMGVSIAIEGRLTHGLFGTSRPNVLYSMQPFDVITLLTKPCTSSRPASLPTGPCSVGTRDCDAGVSDMCTSQPLHSEKERVFEVGIA